MKTNLLAFTILLFTLGCDSETPEHSSAIDGYWINPVYSENGIAYSRANNFKNGGGMAFLAEGKLIERANAGGCGTPPITYANYYGNWQMKADSIIVGTSEYWGGTVDFKFQIKKLTNEKLKLSVLEMDYHME